MRTFRDYIKYANKYTKLAEDALNKDKDEDVEWFLIPSIILAWSAVELFVNNRVGDLMSVPDSMFELHERAFLLEQHLRFADSGANMGNFVLEGKNYHALEDKIVFLMAKSGSKDTNGLKGGLLWQRFQDFKDIRDTLVHPRKENQPELQVEGVKKHIETAKELIKEISKRIWKKEIDI